MQRQLYIKENKIGPILRIHNSFKEGVHGVSGVRGSIRDKSGGFKVK